MTIAAVVRCEDGVVLCADTEATITEDSKGDTSKLRAIVNLFDEDDGVQRTVTAGVHPFNRKGPWYWKHDWAIGIAGAGEADWITAFIEGFEYKALDELEDQQFDWIKFRSLLENHTQEFFSRFIKGHAENPVHRPQAHMLVVVQTKKREERGAFRINDNLVLEDYGADLAVGKGAPVFSYLAERLIMPDYTMKHAASIVVYILKRVKSEVRGCGGNSHVLLIGAGGTLETLTTRRVVELELRHMRIEERTYHRFSKELIKTLP